MAFFKPTQKIKEAFWDFFFIWPTPRLFKIASRLSWGPDNQLSLALLLLLLTRVLILVWQGCTEKCPALMLALTRQSTFLTFRVSSQAKGSHNQSCLSIRSKLTDAFTDCNYGVTVKVQAQGHAVPRCPSQEYKSGMCINVSASISFPPASRV